MTIVESLNLLATVIRMWIIGVFCIAGLAVVLAGVALWRRWR